MSRLWLALCALAVMAVTAPVNGAQIYSTFDLAGAHASWGYILGHDNSQSPAFTSLGVEISVTQPFRLSAVEFGLANLEGSGAVDVGLYRVNPLPQATPVNLPSLISMGTYVLGGIPADPNGVPATTISFAAPEFLDVGTYWLAISVPDPLNNSILWFAAGDPAARLRLASLGTNGVFNTQITSPSIPTAFSLLAGNPPDPGPIVPEPGTLGSCFAALLVLAGLRKYKR